MIPLPSSYLGLDPIDPFSMMVSFLISSRKTILISAVLIWLCLEIGFYIALRFCVWPGLQRLNKSAPYHHTQNPYRTVMRIFDHIDMLGDSYGFERFITGFFRNCDVNDLKLENLHSFLAWCMYSEYYCDLSTGQCEAIDAVIAEAGRRYGYYPESGFNPNLKHVNMTLESIPFVHRPLCIYVGNGFLEMTFQAIYFRIFGFRQLKCGPISYWYRQGRQQQQQTNNSAAHEQQPALLVLHGITNGWVTYAYLVHSLTRLAFADPSSERSMFLIDVDAIKIKSLCFDMPSPDEFPKHIEAVLSRHGVEKVSVVGHSFGSITAGWLVQQIPHMISHLTLVDPVSLLLGLPEVAYNFLYRPPADLIQSFIIYGASREITISHMLHRHFWWHRNIMYLEDVPSHIGVIVAVSSEDPILCATSVHSYSQICNDLRMKHYQNVSNNNSNSNSYISNAQRRTSPRLAARRDKGSNSSSSGSNCYSGSKSPITVIPDYESSASLTDFLNGVNAKLRESLSSNSNNNNNNHFNDSSSINSDSSSSSTSSAAATTIAMPAAIKSIYWEGYTHGQFLTCSKAMCELVDALHTNEGLSSWKSKCF